MWKRVFFVRELMMVMIRRDSKLSMMNLKLDFVINDHQDVFV